MCKISITFTCDLGDCTCVNRYRVSCEGNRLLSYAVLEHSLEDVGSCSGQSLCTDSVNVYLDGYGTNVIKTTCGNEAELGEVQMDGLHEAWIEFKANRKKQFLGFEMFLWCIEPQFDLNYASFYSSNGQNQCNNPSPPGTSGRKKRSAISTLREMVRHITNYKITTGVVNLFLIFCSKKCTFD